MKFILRITICGLMLSMLFSLKTENCRAQDSNGSSSDSTSAPVHNKKKNRHNANEEPAIDTLSISTYGVISDTSSNTGSNKKNKKKKHKDTTRDSTALGTPMHDSTAVTKTDTVASYIPRTPDDIAAAIIEDGNKLQGAGDFKSAIVLFDSVINYYSKTFYFKYAFYYKGQADAFADDKTAALKDFTTFIVLDSCKSPYCSDAHYNRALVYFHDGDFKDAIGDLNFVALHDSTYKNLKYAYLFRGLCYGEQGIYPIAIQDLTRFLLIDNLRTVSSAEALSNRAFYKIKLNDNRGAIQDYDKTVNLYLAVIQSLPAAKQGSYLDKLIETYTLRGQAKAGINKYDDAITDYNLALKYNPNYATAYLLRGLAYINEDKQDLGCLDLSHAGELGASEAYEDIKKYCK